MATIKKYVKKDGQTAWQFQTYLGKNPGTGKDIRTTKRGFKTKKEAQLALNKLLVEAEEKNNFQLKKDITFRELYEMWIAQYRLRVKPSSVAVAQRFCKNHILGKFGNLKLKEISVFYCQTVVNEWHGLYKQYAFLRKTTAQILKFGIAMELLENNPMSKTILPRKIETESKINFYTKEQLLTFLENVKKTNNQKLYTFFRLLSFSGMRKSEALSLQWEDINFSTHSLTIGKTIAIDEFGKVIIQSPKTSNSKRIIMLDQRTLQILKQWQLVQRTKIKIFNFHQSGQKQFIFTNDHNDIYYPQVVNDWMRWIYQKFPMEVKITPHGFRHTHCSLLFESGATIKQVQERLGHKDIKTTMNICAHVTPQSIEQTGEAFARFMEN